MTAYTITITLVVHPESDEHIQTPQAIKAEIASWLEDLGATVEEVSVEGAPR